MDLKKIAEGVRLILEGVEENPSREGLKNTPERVADMFSEILSGISQQVEMTPGFTEKIGEDIVLMKNIPFYSMCEHHLLPFFGKVHLAYAVKDNRVMGFSSITRLVDMYARRLQIQERLTTQIADTLMEQLHPTGVFVSIEAQQLCVSMRNSRKEGVLTVTQAIRGQISMDRIPIKELLR